MFQNFTAIVSKSYHEVKISGLHIRPRGALTTKDQLRAMARGFGLSPEEAARLLASSESHRTYATQQEREEREIGMLCEAITERIKNKILASVSSRTSGVQRINGVSEETR